MRPHDQSIYIGFMILKSRRTFIRNAKHCVRVCIKVREDTKWEKKFQTKLSMVIGEVATCKHNNIHR